MSITAFLDAITIGDQLEVKATGAWIAPHVTVLEQLIRPIVHGPVTNSRMLINAAGLTELDTYGAWLLERLVRDCTDRGREVRVIGLPDRYNELVAEVRNVNRRKPQFRPKRTGPVFQIERLGHRLEDLESQSRRANCCARRYN